MHVVITGASSGLGAALAQEYAAAGAELTLVARRRDLLEGLQRSLPVRTHIVAYDLGNPAAACAWLPASESALGPVDVLINNAGMQIIGPTALAEPETGERLLQLNVHTPMRLTRAVLPGMIARGHGCIVDMASMAALAPTPCMYYYNASKGALAAASEALRGELRKTGVHVVTVYPGPILTDMGKAGMEKYELTWGLRMQPIGRADVLARRVRRAVERRRARVIYPRAYTMTRWFPGLTRWFMDRFTPPLARTPSTGVATGAAADEGSRGSTGRSSAPSAEARGPNTE
jgi:short-subunit dehydrogenase